MFDNAHARRDETPSGAAYETWPAGLAFATSTVMSQHTVASVIDRLLTDEELRLHFAVDRVEALGELHALGLTLTSREIDLFLEADPGLWWWTDFGDRIH